MKMFGMKPKGAPAPAAAVTRDSVDNPLEDELRKRRGGAADILTGTGGAEAGATSKTVLG